MSLARRIAPAAALGGVAVTLVAVLDPALAGADRAATRASEAERLGGQTTSPCASATEQLGPAVDTPWGPVQVAATVTDGQICAVHAVVYPSNDRKSERINASAIPMLDSMATQQGVAFDNVSGATYTTEAYRGSLQQLLDSL